MHEELRIKDPYQRRKAWFRPKNTWEWGLEWERSVWEGEKLERIKRDQEKWNGNCADSLYKNPSFSMDREVSRAIEN